MRILIICMIALFSAIGLAEITQNQEYQLNTQTGPVGVATQMGTLIRNNQNMVVGRYSFVKQGGSSTTSIRLLSNLGDPKSYVKIPYKAIITNVYVNTISTVNSATTTGTADIGILTRGDLVSSRGTSTAFFPIFAGTPQWGTTTTYIKLTSQSGQSTGYIPTVKFGTSAVTSGKFDVYITYALGE